MEIRAASSDASHLESCYHRLSHAISSYYANAASTSSQFLPGYSGVTFSWDTVDLLGCPWVPHGCNHILQLWRLPNDSGVLGDRYTRSFPSYGFQEISAFCFTEPSIFFGLLLPGWRFVKISFFDSPNSRRTCYSPSKARSSYHLDTMGLQSIWLDRRIVDMSHTQPDPSIQRRSLSFNDEKFQPLEAINFDSGVDVSVNLVKGKINDRELTPEESRKLRVKLDWHLLPMLFSVYTLQFVDKTTLGSGFILGLVQDNKLSTDEFNTLGSAFYIGFLIFQYPQNWALQRYPVGKWISLNIFLWSLFLGLHAACHNFGGLFAVRFFLGATEGSIMAGLMLVTSMFYTRTEIAERIGWTFQCNGIGMIVSGFLSFGVVHVSPSSHPHQWQWLMIITSILTFILSVMFFVWFPDNPTSARFLTEEEKIKVVRRTNGNQNGIETKVWKKKQFIEALLDVKTWLFFLFAAIANLQNGLNVESSKVIQSFGFTALQTTLLNIPSGFAQIVGITSCCYVFRRFPSSRAWIIITFYIPSILADLLLMGLPWSNHGGHLAGIYLISGGTGSFVLYISWVASTVAGHTKRLTTNAVFLVGYSLGQILCTQFWKAQYSPRYLVPWGIALSCHIAVILITLTLRHILVKENKRRDALQAASEADGKALGDFDDFGLLATLDSNGHTATHKIDKALLDLTDRENLAFRYVF